MISSILINNIECFINKICIVHEDQIFILFCSTHGAETIEWCCKALVAECEDVVYDITVFTYGTLNSLKLTVCGRRKDYIPDGVEDEIVHIAVLPDEKMMKDIMPLGFDGYCILDKKQGYSPQWLEVNAGD